MDQLKLFRTKPAGGRYPAESKSNKGRQGSVDTGMSNLWNYFKRKWSSRSLLGLLRFKMVR